MINIFIDTSGSMSEMGKGSGAIYVVKSIQDYCEFYSVKSNVYKFDGNIVSDIHSIKFDENIKINLLRDFIRSKNFVGNILVSDGLFDEEILDNTVSISIGVDADIDNLGKVSLSVFEPENIIGALEYLLFINNDSNSIEEEDESDDWD